MCRLDEIKKQREAIYHIAKKYKAKKLYVFGSCARKEEKTNSDIDFLADFDDEVTYLDIAGMFIDLSDLFTDCIEMLPGREGSIFFAKGKEEWEIRNLNEFIGMEENPLLQADDILDFAKSALL